MQCSSSDVGNKHIVQADSDLCILVDEGPFTEIRKTGEGRTRRVRGRNPKFYLGHNTLRCLLGVSADMWTWWAIRQSEVEEKCPIWRYKFGKHQQKDGRVT